MPGAPFYEPGIAPSQYRAAVVFLIRTTGARWPSIFTAALFAAHPLHVESVAWVAERKGILSTSFWILACLAYIAYANSRPWGAIWLSFFSLLPAWQPSRCW